MKKKISARNGSIRKRNQEDLACIMNIWLSSTCEAHSFINKEYWLQHYETVKDVYIPMSDTFVYDDGQEIRGFISIIEHAFIGALFIDKEYQGLGVGSLLIDYVSNEYERLQLAVYKENTKAVNFYLKKGFVIQNEQQNEDSGYVEYIMEKVCNL